MKICIVTATRAEYGLLKPLIEKLKSDARFEVQLLVTGAHLSSEFGLTYKQIEADGFLIAYKAEMPLTSDTAEGTTQSMGLEMISLADAFKKLQPDLLVILGDRYEMLVAASAALIFQIPIAHINGGETTEGAYDDAIRHAITKMSHLHFASTQAYKNRIIQLGEQPENVFNVGALSLDNITNLTLLTKEQLQNDLKIVFKKHNYLITYHPETLAHESVEQQLHKLLTALNKIEDSLFIFTKANADTGGRTINQLIEKYVRQNSDKTVLFDSLGTLRFLSVMKICAAIVGNSSSGIVEAPSLHIATINIGDRQKGRERAISIFDCACDDEKIYALLKYVQQEDVKLKIKNASSPFGEGKTAQQIVDVLGKINLSNLRVKKFYDLK